MAGGLDVASAAFIAFYAPPVRSGAEFVLDVAAVAAVVVAAAAAVSVLVTAAVSAYVVVSSIIVEALSAKMDWSKDLQ